MFRKAVCGIMLFLLLIGVFYLAVNIKSAKGEWTGTVYIRADGSIDPPDAPIMTYDNITYTLTDNITSSGDGIVVERDNIIIDGAGYIIQGAGDYRGIDARGRIGITIKNARILNFWIGIDLYSSSNNIISGNEITNNGEGLWISGSSNNSICGNNITNNGDGVFICNSPNSTISGNNISNNNVGVWLYYSSNDNIYGNNVTNNGDGVYLFYSSNNIISENNITNNKSGVELASSSDNIVSGNTFIGNGLFVRDSYHNVVENNTVNGKPLVYFEETSNQVIDEAGQVILINCNNIIIKNLNLSHMVVGVELWGTSNTTISQNNIANNVYGVYLWSCSNNIISGNNITDNAYGVWLYYSSNNIISGNTFINDGLVIWDSYQNVVVDNTVNGKPLVYLEGIADYSVGDAGQVILVNCTGIRVENLNLSRTIIGVQLWQTKNSVISGNNITANSWYGVSLDYSSNNVIIGNSIANNGYGVHLRFSKNNIISGNNITNNGCGIWLDHSSDNKFYHNNFIDNAWQAADFPWDFHWINIWDDGYPSGGNYWSNYRGVDNYSGPYQNIAGSDGIGDTPYFIGPRSMDRYPLMNPWNIRTPIASFSWSPSTPEVGELVTFDASASMPIGGEIVSYEWDFGDGNHAAGKIATHAYGSAGTFTVTLNVTDSEGLWDIEQKQIEVKAPPPLTVSISPTSASILVGQSVTFTSTTTGGRPPYTYQWYLNGTAVSGATSSSWTFTPTTSGYYIVRLKVTDSLSNTADSNEATVTAAPPITVSISPLSASILVGQSVTFTSTVTGGYTPYSYQWYLNGNPVSGATSPTWTFTPTTSGIYYVNLKVTDGKGNKAQSETARIAVASVPVGGYSIPIQIHIKTELITLYIALLTILTTTYTTIKRKIKENNT